MKITLDIGDKTFLQLKELSRLSGLSIRLLLCEAIWREANNLKPLTSEFSKFKEENQNTEEDNNYVEEEQSSWEF
jgi:hypothetical protein